VLPSKGDDTSEVHLGIDEIGIEGDRHLEMMPGLSVIFRISRMTEGFMRSARRASCQGVEEEVIKGTTLWQPQK
jgi:hypothetical protein